MMRRSPRYRKQGDARRGGPADGVPPAGRGRGEGRRGSGAFAARFSSAASRGSSSAKSVAATSFAAAVSVSSPPSATAAAKMSSGNTVASQSVALLGTSRKPGRRSPFKSSKSLRNPLKKVASALGRKLSGAKSKALGGPRLSSPATAHVKYESSGSSSHASSGSAPPLPDEALPLPQGPEGPLRPVHLDRLSFAGDEVAVNHFRTPDGSLVASRGRGEREDALSASGRTSDSSCSEGYRSFLDLINVLSEDLDGPSHARSSAVNATSATTASAVDATSATTASAVDAALTTTSSAVDAASAATSPAVDAASAMTSPTVDAASAVTSSAVDADTCDEDDDACSIPSLRSGASGWNAAEAAAAAERGLVVQDKPLAARVPPPPDASAPATPADVDEAADATLMWGCLTGLLGSPAPALLAGGEKRPRRSAVDLWRDEAAAGDPEDMVSLSEEDGPDGADDGSLLSMSDEKEDSRMPADDCSIPSVRSTDARGDPCDPPAETDMTAVTHIPPANVDEAADAALMWGCVTSLLGAPAPRCVRAGDKNPPRRTPVNLWRDAVPAGDLEDGLDGADDGSLPSLPDEEDCFAPDHDGASASVGALPLDLRELEDAGDGDSCLVDTGVGVEEGADATLAWGALGLLLGAPAPKQASKNRKVSRQAAESLWSSEAMEEDDLDQVPIVEIDDDGVASISPMSSEECLDDITNLEDFAIANEPEVAPEKDIARGEAADSVLAWSALAALLGSPAPPCVARKKPRSPERNLWDDGHTADEDLEDILLPDQDQVPSIEMDDDGVASISPVSSEGCLDDPADLKGFVIANEAYTAPEHDIAREEAADSVLAWSALAALLGSPAPPCVARKKPRSSEMNLWDDGHEEDEDLDDLLLPAQDSDSHRDSDKESNDKIQPFAPKGCGEEEDTPSVPSLSSTFDEDDSHRSPRTVARAYDDVLVTQARGSSHKTLMVPL